MYNKLISFSLSLSITFCALTGTSNIIGAAAVEQSAEVIGETISIASDEVIVAEGNAGSAKWTIAERNGMQTLYITGTGMMSYTGSAPWSVYSSTVNKIIIADTITNLKANAFEEFAVLTEAVIGTGISYIQSKAFLNCISLEKVYINNPSCICASTAFMGCDEAEIIKAAQTTAPPAEVTVSPGTPTSEPTPTSTAPSTDDQVSVETLEYSDLTENSVLLHGRFSVKRGESGYTYYTGCFVYWEVGEQQTKTVEVELTDDVSDYSVRISELKPGTSYYYYFKINDFEGVRKSFKTENPTLGNDGIISWQHDGNTITIQSVGSGDYENAAQTPWNTYGLASDISSVVIDSSVTRLPAYAFAKLDKLENVSFTSLGDEFIQLKTIGAYAFKDCSNLKFFDFPSKVEEIGDCAFENCVTLKSAVIPEGLRSLGKTIYKDCTGVEELRMPTFSYGDKNFKVTDIMGAEIPSALKKIEVYSDIITEVPEKTFYNCSAVEEIILSPTVEKIGESAFEGCKSLRNLKLPEGVKNISDYAFYNCQSLQEISLNPNMEVIGDGAFGECKALQEIIYPEKLTYVPKELFIGCESLKRVDIHSGVQSIGEMAFMGCKALEEINIPDGVKEIKEATFRGCESLTKIDIPDTVMRMYDNAFTGCTSVSDVKIPFIGSSPYFTNVESKDNTQIFAYLFGGEVPDSVKTVRVTNPNEATVDDRFRSVPPYAFSGCANISDIIIEKGLKVYRNAFEGCTSLSYLYLPITVTEIYENILWGAENLETLVVPFIGSNVSDNGRETSVIGSFFGWSDTDGGIITDIEQVYNEDGDFHYYHIPETLKRVAVLTQINIPYGAFYNCQSLETVSLMSGANMGKHAFLNCQYLKKVKLPSDMEYIGEQSFGNCFGLEKINIPANVEEIGKQAFYRATSLKEIVIPESVTVIADNIFSEVFQVSALENELGIASDGLTITGTENSYAKEFAEQHGINFNIQSKESVESVSTLTMVTKLSNGVIFNITAKEAGTVYVALYDENDVLVCLKQTKKLASDNNVVINDVSVIFTESELSNASKAKVMLWNGMKNATTAEEIDLAEEIK